MSRLQFSRLPSLALLLALVLVAPSLAGPEVDATFAAFQQKLAAAAEEADSFRVDHAVKLLTKRGFMLRIYQLASETLEPALRSRLEAEIRAELEEECGRGAEAEHDAALRQAAEQWAKTTFRYRNSYVNGDWKRVYEDHPAEVPAGARWAIRRPATASHAASHFLVTIRVGNYFSRRIDRVGQHKVDVLVHGETYEVEGARIRNGKFDYRETLGNFVD